MKCVHCGAEGRESVKWARQVTSSGVYLIAWHCFDCNRWAENPVKWVKHSDAIDMLARYGKTIDDLPIVADYSDQYLCRVCGEPAECHHWAPQAMAEAFGPDWYKWPTDPLCLKHHRQWHLLVTPGLVK